MVAALVVTPPINRTMELREDEIKMKLLEGNCCVAVAEQFKKKYNTKILIRCKSKIYTIQNMNSFAVKILKIQLG